MVLFVRWPSTSHFFHNICIRQEIKFLNRSLQSQFNWNWHALKLCVCVYQLRTVTAAVPRAAHGISMAALLPPAAGEAARGSLLRAVAVAAHATLLIIAAWVHLLRKRCIYSISQNIYLLYEENCIAVIVTKAWLECIITVSYSCRNIWASLRLEHWSALLVPMGLPTCSDDVKAQCHKLQSCFVRITIALQCQACSWHCNTANVACCAAVKKK